MKYILVTDFENHWDELKESLTSYPKFMLGRDLLKRPVANGTETIFIKKKKRSSIIEKCWIGRVWDIQFLGGKVFFRVEIQADIVCPSEYASYPNGWFSDPEDS